MPPKYLFSTLARHLQRAPRFAPILLLLLALMGLSSLGAYQVAQRLGLAEMQATGLHRLDLYAASLEREIGKYAFLPGTLELQAEVLDLLAHPAGQKPPNKVNAYLEQLNDRAGTLAIYVINPQGLVLATSNWRRADSYLGENLSFRPYFRDAVAQGSGRFFGIGTTRGEPGYYLASTLVDAHGTQGIAVIKVSLDQLEQSWTTVEAPVLVSDENGVVILGSVPDWKFTTLRTLDEATAKAFDQTQQYNRRALKPLGLRELRELEHGARLVSIAKERPEMVSVYPVAGRFLAQSRALPGTPWTLTVLSHLEQVDEIAQSHALIALIGAALLFVLGLMLNERRRHLKDRLAAREALQAAHDELERKVEQRTADLWASNHRLQAEVTERTRTEANLRAAQDELVQAGKLAAIGQLSTGIAHELNQPLTALRTLSGNSLRFLERGDLATTRTNLERMAQLADRMGRITGQLRSFAHKSPVASRPVPLDQAVANALAVLEGRLAESHATLQCPASSPCPVALCDGNRLEQVLINLIGNALDAVHAPERPRIDIRCSQQADRVQVQVRDHGPGLAEAVQAHLFEPFFTTKEAGVGLGLGLALSAGIVREFQGSLSGANHPEGGAVFTLELPRAPDEPSDTMSPPPMTDALKVLIIEDDPDIVLGCEQALQLEGIACDSVGSAEAARRRLGPDFAGIVVSDIRLPRCDGLAFMRELMALDPELPVVLITGHGDIAMAVQAMKDGAHDFIQKPFAPEYLVGAVRRALEKRRLVLEVRELRRQLAQRDTIEGQLLGQAPGMQRLRQMLAGLASSAADVLIQGETGTGKELVARCLHEASPRRQGNFVAINCGGLPDTLFDSEMFGHEAGAYTGAAKKRIGKIEHANGGTLFLDEIESMPLGMQIKLLRVLQERTLERLGSNTLIPIDCRVIAATKTDLLTLADQGRFRADLYYRLSVATVALPPLRERREDIPLLFEHFALQGAARHQRSAPETSAERMRQLMAYPWPGNVRELRNVAERCVLGIEAGSPPFSGATGPATAQPLAGTVEAFERALIADALRRHGGSLARSAEALGVAKTTLHDKIRKHGLDQGGV